MNEAEMSVRRFQVDVPDSPYKIEAVCVECGVDLIVVVGGGSRYHCGAVGLSLCMPSLKDAQKLTHSTYQIPVPGHKEESLAREGALQLSTALDRNVVLSVGIHEDDLPKERIQVYMDQFNQLMNRIGEAYSAPNP